MQEIKLWSLEQSDKGQFKAVQVETIRNTVTEEMLEDLLVRSPDLLLQGLNLIGRQVPTKGVPLDLLGVDEDGRRVASAEQRTSKRNPRAGGIVG